MPLESQDFPSLFEHLRLSNFHYELPPERIAHFPLEQRDQSKLLCYKRGDISHHAFTQLPELLPPTSMLVFNNTRVVKARLYFRRATGALIEILLLSPTSPHDIQLALQQTAMVNWTCVIGNKKRWKPDEVLELGLTHEEKDILLKANWVSRADNEVQFQWNEGITFSQILQAIGNLPLPPYLNRAATEDDLSRYQTIFAHEEGAVAAPTASLHFTDRVLQQLKEKGIPQTEITLHVGAGTFLPVKEEEVAHHHMHEEQLVLELSQLHKLAQHEGLLIPVGTTAMRFVESIFGLGCLILTGEINSCHSPFHIGSFDLYKVPPQAISRKEALQAVIQLMESHHQQRWIGDTQIYILPGYRFRMSDGLITNFHMPETTLMLLVAALVGDDWKTIYQQALNHEYRFLSYGDSSLLLP